jgi:hypothetical protein
MRVRQVRTPPSNHVFVDAAWQGAVGIGLTVRALPSFCPDRAVGQTE